MPDTPEHVLAEIGTAVIAFGKALQQAAVRLEQIKANAPSPTPPPTPAKIVDFRLATDGYLRLPDIIGRRAGKGRPAIPALIPICAATWYAGIKTGRFPQPVKNGKLSLWRVEDIRTLLAQMPDARPT